MKIHRTAIGAPGVGWRRYYRDVLGDELLCLAGLQNAGWNPPRTNEGVILCFSESRPDGEYSRTRYVKRHVLRTRGDCSVIEIAKVQGQRKPYNYKLPSYVERFLRNHDLAPANIGDTRVLFWWPEYVKL